MELSKDFKSLLSLICEFRLDYKRLNDVSLSDEVYSIGFEDKTDTKGKTRVSLCLTNSKGVRYGLSLRQLAGLRVATGPITAVWFDEYKTDVNGSVFQNVAADLVDKGIDLSTIKFKVVNQLKVRNEQVSIPNTPVYRDTCYAGRHDYLAAVRALLAGKEADFFGTTEYSFGMRDIREKLHATSVKDGQAIEANLVLLPVFSII